MSALATRYAADTGVLGDDPDTARLRGELDERTAEWEATRSRAGELVAQRTRLKRDLARADTEAKRQKIRDALAELNAHAVILPDEVAFSAEAYADAIIRYAAHVLPLARQVLRDAVAEEGRICKPLPLPPSPRSPRYGDWLAKSKRIAADSQPARDTQLAADKVIQQTRRMLRPFDATCDPGRAARRRSGWVNRMRTDAEERLR